VADIVDTETRSRMMARIKGRDTKPELALRKALHKMGFRYRIHLSVLPGRPDLVLPKHNAALFVHGCFWHRHPGCTFSTTPKSNQKFWKDKFEATVRRDARIITELIAAGWRVAIVWECALRPSSMDKTLKKIINWLSSSKRQCELP